MATRSPKEIEKGTEKTEAEQFKDRVRAAVEHGLLTTGTTKLGQREIVVGIPYIARQDPGGHGEQRALGLLPLPRRHEGRRHRPGPAQGRGTHAHVPTSIKTT